MQGSPPHAAAREWFSRRTLSGEVQDIGAVALALSQSGRSVTVCLPALNESATIGPICELIRDRLVEVGVVDQLLVIDSGSSDGTGDVASRAGATVHEVSEILPHIPAVPGKGEALWRSLEVATGDVIVYLDSDVQNFDVGFVVKLLQPLVSDPDLGFVKAFYERPLGSEGTLGGGRVTELVARPLLNLFFPELSGFVQPLAGEYAARTELLRGLPFFCGYAVEIGMLIDVAAEIGLDGMAQVDLGARVHRNRPTAALAPMAFEITKAVMDRAEAAGRAKLEGQPTDVFATFEDDRMQLARIELRERPPHRN